MRVEHITDCVPGLLVRTSVTTLCGNYIVVFFFGISVSTNNLYFIYSIYGGLLSQ